MRYVDQIKDELRMDKKIYKKYYRAGIYSISIGNKIVYIGKSKNMLFRIAEHICGIQNQNSKKPHKYKILALAKFFGYPVNFDVLYYAKSQDVDDEIGFKEAELINEIQPVLNYQIPNLINYHHFSVNKAANTISLQEIIKGQENKTDLI